MPLKCSPLAQIRREQKMPGPLLLVYFMLQAHQDISDGLRTEQESLQGAVVHGTEDIFRRM